MEIRDYQLGDEQKIIPLFEMVFKQKMTQEQWNWRFRDNPAGKYFIKLMWDGDLLVGHYAVSPIIVKIEGVKQLTAHSLTTMTHPDYGGKGIFKTLALEIYNDLENKHDCKAVWGFPNTNSHYGFINSLGWKDINVLHTLGLELDVEPILSEKNYDFIEVNEFNDELVNLFNKPEHSTQVGICKSIEYLNWRYKQKPSVKYRFFYAKSQRGVNFFVTKLYHQKDGKTILNLVEAIVEDFVILNDVLKNVVAAYKQDIAQVTVWQNIHLKSHRNFEKSGFKPIMPLTYLGALKMNNVSDLFFDFRNWTISMGDSDVF